MRVSYSREGSEETRLVGVDHVLYLVAFCNLSERHSDLLSVGERTRASLLTDPSSCR